MATSARLVRRCCAFLDEKEKIILYVDIYTDSLEPSFNRDNVPLNAKIEILVQKLFYLPENYFIHPREEKRTRERTRHALVCVCVFSVS